MGDRTQAMSFVVKELGLATSELDFSKIVDQDTAL